MYCPDCMAEVESKVKFSFSGKIKIFCEYCGKDLFDGTTSPLVM